MADVAFVAIVVAFFAVALLYVHACGAVVGATATPPVDADLDEDEEVAT